MIQVLPLKDSEKVLELYKKSGIEYKGGECVTAANGEEVLGYCLFTVVENTVTVHEIVPADDILMADGVLRSALFAASQRFVFKAYYDNENLKDLLLKLGFIKDDGAMELDMDKLFRSCGH